MLQYALFEPAVELRTGKRRQHCLAILGKCDFARQWKRHFTRSAEFRDALADADLTGFVATRPALLHDHVRRLREIVADLEPRQLNYGEFAAILRSASPSASVTTPGVEVCRNLTDGMTDDLARRELAARARPSLISAARGRPGSLPDRDQRGASGHRQSQEM